MSIEKNIFEILEEIKKTKNLISETIILSESSAFSPPLKKLQVTSGFGPRWGRNHDGVDLAAVDEPVKSLADGVVITTHPDKYPCGGTIVIQHSDGYTTGFCHIQKINVQVGQNVRKGDVIGITGGGKNDPGKGRSDGKHLHLTIRKDGKPLDPMKFIDKEGVLVGSLPPSPTAGTDVVSNATTSTTTPTQSDGGYVPPFGAEKTDFLYGNIPSNIEDFDFLKGIVDSRIIENINKIKNLL